MALILSKFFHAFLCYESDWDEKLLDQPLYWFDLVERKKIDACTLCERFKCEELNHAVLKEAGYIPMPPVRMLDIDHAFYNKFKTEEMEEYVRGIDDNKKFDIKFREYVDHRNFPILWEDFYRDYTIEKIALWAQENNIEHYIIDIDAPDPSLPIDVYVRLIKERVALEEADDEEYKRKRGLIRQ